MSGFALLIRDCHIVNSGFEDTIDIFVQDGIIRDIKDHICDETLNVDNMQIIETHGMHLTPGLIDCHVHLILNGSPDIVDYVKNTDEGELAFIAAKNSLISLESGITTLRDMGCTSFIVPTLKKNIKKGMYQGPRIYAAGHMITRSGGHVKHIARETDGTSNDIKEAVREQVQEGADFIKLIVSGGLLTPKFKPTDTELDKKLVAAAINEALKFDLKTAVHVYGDEDIKAVLKAGAWTIEHGSWASTETLEMAAKSNVFFVPTLKAAYDIIENSDNLPDYVVKNASDVLDATRRVLPNAVREGVCVAMGTDAGTPYNYHGDNVKELEYMSELGMSNEEVLKAATVNASKLTGRSHLLGQVKTGYKADLLLMDANPLDDIKAFKNAIKYVIQDGQIIRDTRHSFLES
jgi:imidazolonepropionase-like amidohydrolase